jgi:rod shape-determining protein MreC
MRNLLRFLLKHHLFLLFLFLEFLAIIMLVRFNSFQSARIFTMRHSIVGGISERYHSFSKYLSLEEQNRSLIKENARLYNMLDKSYYSLVNDSYSDTLAMQEYIYIPARVINNSVNKQYNYITINKGKLQGIEEDMGVIGPDGLVGVVKATSEHYASIVPILNREFFPNAQIQKTNYFGYIEWPGTNYREVILKDIPLHAKFNIGDTIETSGYTATFPRGITIGTIADYEIQQGVSYKIKVNLSTDFKRLTHVMVIKNLLKEEQKALEDSTSHD